MKVIIISKVFPKGHPRQGEPTRFVQKILHSILPNGMKPISEMGYPAKFHTIRAGYRFKVGDVFSARIWTGLPYRSKQKEICQLQVKKLWDFKMTVTGYLLSGKDCDLTMITELAKNDGFDDPDDFETWFAVHPKAKKEGFSGQVICWSDKINY